MLSELIAQAQILHEQRYGVAPGWVASAPGRVNLIGDHTDYTGGYAMPFAINRYTLVCASLADHARHQARHQAYSEFSQALVDLELGPPRGLTEGASWFDYVVGVMSLMSDNGYEIPCLQLSIHGNLPVGSGLSSSASLELAIATLIEGVCDRSMVPKEKMLLCQQVEHEYARVPCGLMDQYAVCAGEQDHLLQLDCNAQTAQMVPIPGEAVGFLIMDSQVRHQHSGGGYAQRRDECFAAQEALGLGLHQANEEQVASLEDPRIRQRAQHVITENARVATLAEAMRNRDFTQAGATMNLSHISLRDDFDVSCPEVDQLVALTQQQVGVFGARMTGGGFGGSVVAMVEPTQVTNISEAVAASYRKATGLQAQPLVVSAVDGAQLHDV